MDFNSLGVGSDFYVLEKTSEKPVLKVGRVTSKMGPHAPYTPQNQQAFQGLNTAFEVDFVVNVDGREENFPNIPAGLTIVRRGEKTFTGDKESIMQAIDAMMATSRANLANRAYDEAAIEAGEGMLETLNPRYAAERQQARAIKAIEARQDKTDEALGDIRSMLKKLVGGKGD